MVLFQKKKKKYPQVPLKAGHMRTKMFYSWAILFILIIFSGVLLFGVVDIIKKSQQTKKNKEVATKQLITLQGQNIQLESMVKDLKTEQGVESSIRDRFSMVKDGEEFVIIVDDTEKENIEDNKRNGRSFIQFFKNLFTKN